MNNPQNMAVMTGAQAQTVQGEKTFDDLKSHSGSTVNFDAGSLSLNNPSAVFAESVHGLVPAPAAGDAAAGMVLGAGGTWVPRDGVALPYIQIGTGPWVNHTLSSGYIISLGEPAYQQGGMIATSNTVTIPFAGIYLIEATVCYAANEEGSRQAAIDIFSSVIADKTQWNPGSYDMTINLTSMHRLLSGTQIRVITSQTSGSPLNVRVDSLRVAFLSKIA